MQKPLISIVLGSYNRYAFLPLTIESVRKELEYVPHEIIVVDGGSDDGALTWLMQQKDIITVVQHNRGQWQSKAIERRSWGYFMNLGFKISQGAYVCMLSDDCLVVPGAIKNGIVLFDSLQAMGRKIGALAFYWRDWSRDETYHVGHTLGNKLYVNHGMFLREALHVVNYVDEETFFFYNGDGDLCLKLWQQGYAVLESPDSYIEHYPHANPKIRKTNYDCHRHDHKKYLEKWKGVFYDPSKNNIGMIIEKSHVDIHKTGALFQKLHEHTIEHNPNLVKQSKRVAFVRRLKWISRSIKARCHKFLSR